MMKPETIEHVREWAASGNEPRFAVDVDGVLPEELWKMLDKDEDSLCELTPLSLTIAAQAERIRELEGAVTIDRARRIREIETALAGLRATLAEEYRENDKLIARIRELEAFRFSVAEKTGVMHIADGHAPEPGPDDAILEDVARGVAALKKEAEFAHERHVLNEQIRELALAFAQACEVAVEAGSYVDEYSFQKWLADGLETMHANIKRLTRERNAT